MLVKSCFQFFTILLLLCLSNSAQAFLLKGISWNYLGHSTLSGIQKFEDVYYTTKDSELDIIKMIPGVSKEDLASFLCQSIGLKGVTVETDRYDVNEVLSILCKTEPVQKVELVFQATKVKYKTNSFVTGGRVFSYPKVADMYLSNWSPLSLDEACKSLGYVRARAHLTEPIENSKYFIAWVLVEDHVQADGTIVYRPQYVEPRTSTIYIEYLKELTCEE